MNAKKIISQLTLEEKAALLGGKNEWESRTVERLGISSVVMSDGPHGLRCQAGLGDHLGINESLPATCFPTAATVANSWDESLGETIGSMLGEEALAQGVDIILGPGVNMKRTPLCGRNFEYFSEDPYLAGKMAASYVRGIQSKHVYACLKHFAVNSREYRRMAMNAVVDERTLREIYLTAFEIGVKEGGAKTIMSSYNEVNGTYSNENYHLLSEILRDEWGFDGIVVSDWGASNDHVESVKCRATLEMPNPGLDSAREVVKAVRDGRLKEEQVDEALRPLIEAALYVKDNNHKIGFDEESHHKVAKRAALCSAVLLKNEDNILPLKPKTMVALKGPFVEKPRFQGAGSSVVNATKIESVKSVIDDYDLTVVEDPALADVVLYFFGLDEIAESEGGDRKSMKIPEYQIKELQQLYEINPHIVGVISAGSAIEMPWIDKLQAVLHGYLAGQAGASAMLDLLTGKANPMGKLSESYPFSYEECPVYHYADEEKRNLEYREGLFIGYRYYDTAEVPVAFPFGFGLSYTTFAYSNLTVQKDKVTFDITNTGDVEGTEIAQLYVGKKDSKIIRPRKELKGFAKVWLHAGETKTVEILFDDKTFRYFNTATNKWETEGGTYELYIGKSSAQIELTGSIEKQQTTDVLPYDINDFPSYKTGKITEVSDEEFARLYGKELPTEHKGELQFNDALCQMKNAKNIFARGFYKRLKRDLDKTYEKGVPDLTIMFLYNMPFRAMSKMAGNNCSREMAEGVLAFVNGHFFQGVHKFVGGYFRNALENKKYEKLLKK